jgi:cytochrome P450
MVLYPEVQKRAQEEIDSVLGHGHLPQFEDEDALPYLKAVRYELLRWSPPAHSVRDQSSHSQSTHESSFQVSRIV